VPIFPCLSLPVTVLDLAVSLGGLPVAKTSGFG
jgi:hypothetical protein